MKRLVGAVACGVLLLTGCTGTPAPAPTPTETLALPAAPALTCDDIASSATVMTALASEVLPGAQLVQAVRPEDALGVTAVRSEGGLVCSWRLGDPAEFYGQSSGDWAYLTISVLPESASAWVPVDGADLYSDDTSIVAGIQASTAQDDDGWTVSGPVGDSWAEVDLSAGGFTDDEGRFTDDTYDATAGRVQAVAAEVFAAVKASAPLARADQLAEAVDVPGCDGPLSASVVAAGLGLAADDSDVSIDDADVPDSPAAEAISRAGAFVCDYDIDGSSDNEITVLPTGASLLTGMSEEADFTTVFTPVTLQGAPAETVAFRADREDGPQSPVVFALGDRLYVVRSADGPTAIAEAIVAASR